MSVSEVAAANSKHSLVKVRISLYQMYQGSEEVFVWHVIWANTGMQHVKKLKSSHDSWIDGQAWSAIPEMP